MFECSCADAHLHNTVCKHVDLVLISLTGEESVSNTSQSQVYHGVAAAENSGDNNCMEYFTNILASSNPMSVTVSQEKSIIHDMLCDLGIEVNKTSSIDALHTAHYIHLKHCKTPPTTIQYRSYQKTLCFKC